MDFWNLGNYSNFLIYRGFTNHIQRDKNLKTDCEANKVFVFTIKNKKVFFSQSSSH